MIVTVDSTGYRDAAAALAGGNEVAALQYDSLVGKLGAFAGMAGSDSTAEQFVAAYDAAAADAVGGLADLVDAFANLGRITQASAANHERAEAASLLMPGATVYDPASSSTGTPLTVLPATPPSSLGGDPPYLNDLERFILDHVGGFLWPNADTACLREAAAAWQVAADGLHVLAEHCTSAVACLDTQRSPEIPVAIACSTDLRTTTRDLAAAFADLGARCEEYAAYVDAKHAELHALLQEIVRMVEEQIALSAALSVISFGIGAAAGAAGLVLRIAREAPRFARIINALEALADGVAVTVRGTRDAIALKRAELAKYLRAGVRDERGAFQVLPAREWRAGWLERHEAVGGHTLARHVGQSVEQLMDRIAKYGKDAASSFADGGSAERFAEATIKKNAASIQAWLRSGGGTEAWSASFAEQTGITVTRAGEVLHPSSVRVVLRSDPSMPDGYRVLSCFPEP